jgi:hypothetical protein
MTATLGLDLASQAKNTALCVIEWSADGAEVVALLRGVDGGGTPLHDKLIVSVMRGLWGGLPAPTKVAIDAPLGWPVDFVRAVRDPGSWPIGLDADRKRLQRRATDYWVHDRAAKLPLSVTTDRIAYAAMRAAGVLAHYERTFDESLDRSGVAGLVCETYPDPAIRGLGPLAGGRRPTRELQSEGRRTRRADRGVGSSQRPHGSAFRPTTTRLASDQTTASMPSSAPSLHERPNAA